MSNLYVVSTPIGNLQDLTLRAASTIIEAKTIIAESTSKAGILTNFISETFKKPRNPDQKIISMTEDEEELKINSILKILESDDCVLISEAGTPLVSDPGFKLVRKAIALGFNIISVPGATAPIAALAASGLPTDKFLFLGYLSKSQIKKKNDLEKLHNILSKDFSPTVIFFESPHRLIETLEVLLSVFGDIDIVVARELTKVHEEIARKKISIILEGFKLRVPKGEFVVLFSTKS